MRKHTEEEKARISQALKGKPKSLEHRGALSIAMKGHHSSPVTEFKRVAVPYYKGKHIPQDVKQKLSHANKNKHSSPKTEFRGGQHISPDTEFKRGLTPWWVKKGLPHPSKDPEYMRKVLCSRRPTDIEQRILDIINKYSLPYRYTGNGTFQVGWKYPDFVNTNNEKIALDIFGDHWHNPNEIPMRKAIFAEYGWELLVIWGHEIKQLSEAQIVKKIKTFTKGRREICL